MFFEIYRKRGIIKKRTLFYKGHPSTTSDPIWMILPPLDSLELELSNGMCFIQFRLILSEIL